MIVSHCFYLKPLQCVDISCVSQVLKFRLDSKFGATLLEELTESVSVLHFLEPGAAPVI